MTTLRIPKFRSAARAVDFAIKHNLKFDENIEKLIAQDGDAAYAYAENVLKGRFELGEPAIAETAFSSDYHSTNVIPAFAYARLMGRFELLESKIINDPKLCYYYADAINKRFELGEPTIAKDADFSYQYARNIINGRFELGEPTIAKDADAASSYASYVIHGRFELGEEAISKDAKQSWYYASNVLRDRFEPGEDAIAQLDDKGEFILRNYIDLTKQKLNESIHNLMLAKSLSDDKNMTVKKYFRYIKENNETLNMLLKDYPMDMTVKQILENIN